MPNSSSSPTKPTRKVIALYIIAGFGHLKPAIATLEQIRAGDYPVETEAWDIHADASGESVLDKNSLYNRISTHPTYIKYWNKLTSSQSATRHLSKPIQKLDLLMNQDLKRRFRHQISQNPDTIFFATHFTPANVAAKALPNHKIFLYVTDIHPHPIWAINRPNLVYLVPTEYTKKLLESYGIKSKNIKVASFPINPVLLKGAEKRHRARLKNLKTEKSTDILIISGGAGTGRIQMENLLSTFAAPAHSHDVEIKFLASTMKLRDDLKETRVVTGLPKGAVEIDTYKPDILYRAMRWSEVLVTKAGGDITFEALAEGLPVYTLKDVGDHERINRQYMEKAGASRQLESGVYPWELIHHDLLTGRLQQMAQASWEAGAFHRQATVPQILFDQVGWQF